MINRKKEICYRLYNPLYIQYFSIQTIFTKILDLYLDFIKFIVGKVNLHIMFQIYFKMCKLIKIKSHLKFSSLVTFQVLIAHMWLEASILTSAGLTDWVEMSLSGPPQSGSILPYSACLPLFPNMYSRSTDPDHQFTTSVWSAGNVPSIVLPLDVMAGKIMFVWSSKTVGPAD